MPTDPASQSPPTKSSYRALLLLVEIMTALETDALHENIVRGTLKFVEPGTEFCSWTIAGMPNIRAINTTGALT